MPNSVRRPATCWSPTAPSPRISEALGEFRRECRYSAGAARVPAQDGPEVTRLQADDTWWLGVAVAAFAVIAGQTVMVVGEAPAHAPWIQFVAITLTAASFPLIVVGAEQAMRWPPAT